MANLYPYFDKGTFENYPAPYNNEPNPGPNFSAFGRTSSDAYEGSHSLLLKMGSTAGKGPGVMWSLYFALRNPSYWPIILEDGKRYRVSARLKTLNGAGQLGSDGLRVMLCDSNTQAPGGSVTSVVADGEVWTLSNGDVIKTTKVESLKNGWVEVYFEFTEQGTTGSTGQRVPFGIYITKDSTKTNPAIKGDADAEVYSDGQLFIDKVVLEGLSECDLAFSVPAYTKTDETAEGANDGTIAIHATSSQAIEYSLNGGAFQLSNEFTGLAPGLYDITVRDLAGCEISISDVPILSASPAPPPPPPPPAGTLSVDQRPVNAGNFISWFAANGKADFGNLVFTNCYWDLPNAYRVNKISQPHRPVIVNDEQFSFYLNFESDYSYPNFSSLRLDLVSKYGIVQSGVGVLQRVFQPDGIKYFIYANVTITGKAPGVYRLMIVDTSTAAPFDVLFISQELELLSAEDAAKYTARFRFRASVSIYRYLYSEITDFLQQIRLRVNVVDEATEGQLEQYRAVSSGRLRNVSFDLDRFITLETYYFDDLAHRAMQVLQAHDYILLNERSYLVKSLYKVSRDPGSNVNKGTLELYEQAFSMANRYGGDPNAETAQDPALLGDNDQAILI